MLTSKDVVKLIESQSGKITSEIIKDLIKEHKNKKENYEKLYKIYAGDVEIKERKFVNKNKVNNKINNDYAGDIVDNMIGYMFGEEISYVIDKTKYNETDLKKYSDKLENFRKFNSIPDLDSTTAEMTSICGVGGRLLYVDKEGQERIMNLNPWEVIFVNDPTLDIMKYALIYYPIEIKIGKDIVKRTKVEWYDEQNVSFFISDEKGEFVPDSNIEKTTMPHMFKFVPVIKFANNNLEQGDFEKVLETINSYDRTISDMQNEIEEFRIAYFAWYGAEPTVEVIQLARETGALFFQENTDGKFITKPLDQVVEFMKDHKKTLNDNIYKFSKSVDMRDESFSGGAVSGESRKWKLFNFENRAKSKERKFEKALRYQFKVLCSAWQVKELNLDHRNINFVFKRNLPVDVEYEARATSQLVGKVSEDTRLGLVSFVTDVDAEKQKMEDDKGIDLDKIDALKKIIENQKDLNK